MVLDQRYKIYTMRKWQACQREFCKNSLSNEREILQCMACKKYTNENPNKKKHNVRRNQT